MIISDLFYGDPMTTSPKAAPEPDDGKKGEKKPKHFNLKDLIINLEKIDSLHTTQSISIDIPDSIRDSTATLEKWKRFKESLDHQNAVSKLQKEIQETLLKLEQERLSNASKSLILEELKQKVINLDTQNRLGFLLNRTIPKAHPFLTRPGDLSEHFLKGGEYKIIVMSVDIRRSTELMLKAKSPEKFASFITRLCSDFEFIIKQNYGVIDKFTGDGILAFFPDFYSGQDAAYWAIKSASECHHRFANIYRELRSSFSSVLSDVGLGIGIDYGSSHLVQMAGGLTVVGAPVVYACRLGSAPANCTYLNQPAFELVNSKYSPYCTVNETILEIKHEGKIVVYDVKLNKTPFSPAVPNWERSAIVNKEP